MNDLETWAELFLGSTKMGFVCRQFRPEPKPPHRVIQTHIVYQSIRRDVVHHRQRLRCTATGNPKWSECVFQSHRSVISDIRFDGQKISGKLNGKFISLAVPPKTWPTYGLHVRAQVLRRQKGMHYGFDRLREVDLGTTSGCKLEAFGPEELDTPRGKMNLWRVDEYYGSRKGNAYWLNDESEVVVMSLQGSLEIRAEGREKALEGLSTELLDLAEATIPKE